MSDLTMMWGFEAECHCIKGKEKCDMKNFLIKFQATSRQWNAWFSTIFIAILSLGRPRPNLSMSSIEYRGNHHQSQCTRSSRSSSILWRQSWRLWGASQQCSLSEVRRATSLSRTCGNYNVVSRRRYCDW